MPLIDMRNRNLTWEQLFDTPTIITHYAQETEQQQVTFKFVDRTNRTYRKPPVHFSISIERIDGDSQKMTCRPGSIIEGVVKIKLYTPLAAHHLKVVYKGIEIFYDHSIGLSNINNNLAPKKKKGDTFFSIQTHLWGIHNDSDEWPLLEAGDHQFPFMCEMPMINYPPSIKHNLVSCDFEMIASLERPGIRPFHTIPIPVQYEPFILSTKDKFPDLYQQSQPLDSTTKIVLVLPKGCDYNLLDTNAIPIQLHVKGDSNTIKNMQIYLKRKLKVNFGSCNSSDVMVMSHMEQSKFKYLQPKKNHTVYSITLPTKDLTTTVTKELSQNLQIEYLLELTAKTKHGFKSKTLFSIPLHFGTTAPGEQLPFNLQHYKEVKDHTLTTRPKFIKVPHEIQDLLPSYHEDTSPPIYLNDHSLHVNSSTQLNRMRLMIA